LNIILFAKLFHKLPGAKWLELLVLLYDFLFLPTKPPRNFSYFIRFRGQKKVAGLMGHWPWISGATGALAAGQWLDVIEKLHKKWQISQLKFWATLWPPR